MLLSSSIVLSQVLRECEEGVRSWGKESLCREWIRQKIGIRQDQDDLQKTEKADVFPCCYQV